MEVLVRNQGLPGLREFISFHPRKILLGVISLIMAVLILPPMVVLLVSSFRSTRDRLPFEAVGFTLANYVNVFTSEVTYRLLLNTAWYAMGTVALSVGIATFFAWFLERTNIPLRRVMFVMILAPMGIPTIISSMAWILLASPSNGLFNEVLRGSFGLGGGPGPINIYTIPGMIVVSAMSFVPVIYLMISGVFSRVDPSLEEAAKTSGAGSWATFRRISMPLLGPALFAAAIYYLVIAIETFEIPAMLGMPKRIFVFSTVIYYAIHPVSGLPDYGLGATYGTLLLFIAGVLIYFYARYVRHTARFATVTGRGYRPRLIDLGRWRFVPVLIMSLYFFFAVGMPLLILLWTSLAPPYTSVSLSVLPQLNLDAYREMLRYGDLWEATGNTLVIAAVTASLTMLLVTVASWFSVRGGIRGAWIPDRLAFVILGIPVIVLAMALMFIYASLPLPIYGTIWIIIIGLMTRSLPFGTRLMNAAFLQIHLELEEAAATSGAGLRPTFFRIVLPLLWPSFARGFLWAFVRAMRETTTALMLYAAGNQTVAVILWFLWVENGDFGLASAIAVPLLVVTMILTYFVARQTMLTAEG
jgi:iron(III) transport system permease protein